MMSGREDGTDAEVWRGAARVLFEAPATPWATSHTQRTCLRCHWLGYGSTLFPGRAKRLSFMPEVCLGIKQDSSGLGSVHSKKANRWCGLRQNHQSGNPSHSVYPPLSRLSLPPHGRKTVHAVARTLDSASESVSTMAAAPHHQSLRDRQVGMELQYEIS